jgi:hypothetical protein
MKAFEVRHQRFLSRRIQIGGLESDELTNAIIDNAFNDIEFVQNTRKVLEIPAKKLHSIFAVHQTLS